MTKQDHLFNALDDVLVLLSGQGFPTPERTYKLDGGWGLALSDLRRCFDQYRARITELQSERVALAWQNVELRRAAQNALEECVDLIGTEEGKRLETVLALPLPDASVKVAEWKQKAEEFDGLMNNPAIRAAIYPLAVSALRAARGAK